MEFGILGPLAVRADGRAVPVAGARPRAVLAMLVLHAPEPVSADRLAVELWGEDAPAGAVQTVQVHVSRLRKALGEPDVVATSRAGYRLGVDPEEIDARAFEAGLARVLQADSPNPAELRALLSLWRGDALSEFSELPCARLEAARLEELRVDAQQALHAGELARGRVGSALGAIRRLAERHPQREGVQALLMRALYATGRQAEALETFRRTRERMVGELGIEPGAELRELQTAILRQDSSLTSGAMHRADRASPAPIPTSPIVGRARELKTLRTLLADPMVRLITVTGPGGVGKTRLVLEVVNDCRDPGADVAFVPLSSVADAEHVGSALARTLGAELLPSEPIESALRRQLRGATTLLVLDTFEHVLDAASLLATLLDAAPRLTALVTSRESLHLGAEHVLPISPLPCDDTGTGTAAALFAQITARRGIRLAAGDRDAVQRLCRRLDGLPLAIELAVGRLGLLGPGELLERLGNDLAVLGPGPRDAAARHRTLTGAIAWSYRLLSARERTAFEALSVFSGAAALDAAESVSGAPLAVLEGLVEKHLVEPRPDGQQARLAMLDTVRAFARQRLAASGEAADVHRRHAEYCLQIATAVSAEIERTHAASALAEFDRQLDDHRAAVEWTIAKREPELALRLATALAFPCWTRYLSEEAAGWLEDALALGGTPGGRAAALNARAFLLVHRPHSEQPALAAARESAELRRSLRDQSGTAESLATLAKVHLLQHRSEDAYRAAREAEWLARASGKQVTIQEALRIRVLATGSLAEAVAIGDDLAAAYRAAGNTWKLADLRSPMAYFALALGDPEAAMRLAAEGLAAAEHSADAWKVAGAAGNAGLAALLSGDETQAAKHFGSETRFFLDHFAWSADMLYEGLSGLAAVAAARRHDELSARLVATAEMLTYERHAPAVAEQLESRFFTPARARLGDARWAAAYATGRKWMPAEAFAAACADLLAPPTGREAVVAQTVT